MTTRWVSQEEPWGCGPATLAMLLGCTYAEAKAKIDALWDRPKDWTTEGCSTYDLDRPLYAAGFYKQTRHASWGFDLAEPFAPIHYAMVVQPSGNSHFVAMLADGRVLDPMREGFYTLADWTKVNQVCGLVKP